MADRITTSESLGPNPHPQTGSRPASQPATAEAQGQPNPARGSSRSHESEDKPDGTPLETSAKIDSIKKQIEDIALAARDLPSSEELASFNTSMAMAGASLETLRSAEVQRAAEETEKDD
jgi:hypothetical protein